MFDDNLVTVSDIGKELGEFTVNIEATRYKGLECFLIHANSHGAVDGVPCGTSIVCYVSKCLETLEQQHHEYVKVRFMTFSHSMLNTIIHTVYTVYTYLV